jgi:hypothetical protein
MSISFPSFPKFTSASEKCNRRQPETKFHSLWLVADSYSHSFFFVLTYFLIMTIFVLFSLIFGYIKSIWKRKRILFQKICKIVESISTQSNVKCAHPASGGLNAVQCVSMLHCKRKLVMKHTVRVKVLLCHWIIFMHCAPFFRNGRRQRLIEGVVNTIDKRERQWNGHKMMGEIIFLARWTTRICRYDTRVRGVVDGQQ